MKCFPCLLIAGTLVATVSCNFIPGARTPFPLDKTAVSGAPLQGTEVHERDVGDVEAALKIDGVLSKKSEAPNIAVESMVNMRNQLDLTTININPPFPQELWVSFVLKSKYSFADAPVVMRGKIMRDKEALETFNSVLSANAGKDSPEYTVNVLKNLPNPPDSMLVYAQAELLLLPKGTDPTKVDPATATVAPEARGNLVSNPVRINFKSGTSNP